MSRRIHRKGEITKLIKPKVLPETYSALNDMAGPYGLGVFLDKLVNILDPKAVKQMIDE